MSYKKNVKKPKLPNLIENWIKDKIGNPVSVAKDVKRLSEIFTKYRGESLLNGKYMEDDELRKAYLAFFLPKNILKISCIMREFAVNPNKTIRIADIGSGPGTASIGLMSFFAENGIKNIEINLLESNRENNELAMESLETLYHEIQKTNTNFKAVFSAKTSTLKNQNMPLDGVYDILLFSNSINEMNFGVDVLEGLVDRHLSEDGSLIIIEPALKLTSRSLIDMRNKLIDRKKLFPWAPCPNILPCPAFSSCNDWCHEEKDWNPPQFVDKISRIIGNKKNTLKYSFMLLKKQKPLLSSSEGLLARAISFPIKEKGRVLVHICSNGKKLRATLAKSKKTPSNEALMSISHGDMLILNNVKIVDEAMIIGKESKVEIIQ